MRTWQVVALVLAVALVGLGGRMDLDLLTSIKEEEVSQEVAGVPHSPATLLGDQHPDVVLPFLRPICPDQWIAQRSAGRWRVQCVVASTEGSRVGR